MAFKSCSFYFVSLGRNLFIYRSKKVARYKIKRIKIVDEESLIIYDQQLAHNEEYTSNRIIVVCVPPFLIKKSSLKIR